MGLKRRLFALATFLTLVSGWTLQAQEITIHGTVIDDDGQPAISIVIRDKDEKGNVYGITDLDGKFNIKADANTSLHFSGLTYTSKVVKVKGKSILNVVIAFESQQLDEVVVIAKRIVNKLLPEPTDIEIVGNQYIIRPKVKIPKEMYKANTRIVVQPMLVNATRKTNRLFRPAVVTGKEYFFAIERMLEFDLDRDPLKPYYQETTKVDKNEVVAYVDSLYLDNPDDECSCDIYMYLVNYWKVGYQDTVVIAKGVVNPLRFFEYKLTAAPITDEKYVPRPTPQMRGDKGRVNLTFLIDKAVIDPSEPNNAVELEKMRQRLTSIENDPNSDFMAFAITAISSPEGPYESNLKLARKRSVAAKEKIFSFLQSGTIAKMQGSVVMDAQVDTWSAAADLMDADSVPTQAMRDIIGKFPNSTAMQYQQIRHLPNYRSVIFDRYLKQLRRVEYSFEYSVMRLLNDDEIRQVYARDYKELVPYEFWRMIASEKVDSLREKLCRQALEVYPKLMLAANELAVMLINRGEPDSKILAPYVNDHAPVELLANQVAALMHEKSYIRADSVASLMPASPLTDDIQAIAGAFRGNFQIAYDRFGAKGGINEVVLLLALKRNEEAYEKAQELGDEPMSEYLRAVTCNRTDRITEAFAYLKRALDGDPELMNVARVDGDIVDVLQQMEEDKKAKKEEAERRKNEPQPEPEAQPETQPEPEPETEEVIPVVVDSIPVVLDSMSVDSVKIMPVVLDSIPVVLDSMAVDSIKIMPVVLDSIPVVLDSMSVDSVKIMPVVLDSIPVVLDSMSVDSIKIMPVVLDSIPVVLDSISVDSMKIMPMVLDSIPVVLDSMAVDSMKIMPIVLDSIPVIQDSISVDSMMVVPVDSIALPPIEPITEPITDSATEPTNEPIEKTNEPTNNQETTPKDEEETKE